MGWLIALGVVTLLAVMPVGVNALYHKDGFFLWLVLGPVKLQILPAKPKEEKKADKKKEKKKKPAAPKQKKEAPTPKEKKEGGSWTDFLPLVKTIGVFLKGFFKAIRVRYLEVILTMGGGDPCDLAVNYGKTWAVVANAMPLLDKLLVIKKRKVDVGFDFTADATTVYAQADVVVGLGTVIALVIRYGVKLLMQYISIKNSRKAV